VSELAALAAKLLLTLQVLSGYPQPEAPPPVELVTPAELRRHACQGNCQVQAMYLPQRGVLISDRLDPVHDVRARAVLLHELVHYAQHLAGRWNDRPPCERYFLREREAYAVENRYLARYGEPPSHGLMMLMQGWDISRCEELQR
jgi:hypothetical protein